MKLKRCLLRSIGFYPMIAEASGWNVNGPLSMGSASGQFDRELIEQGSMLRRIRHDLSEITGIFGNKLTQQLICFVLSWILSNASSGSEIEKNRDGQLDENWQFVFSTLEKVESLESSFQEKRYRPFRRIPATFQGTVRLHPEAGFSITYREPSFSLLHFYQGTLFRKKENSPIEPVNYPEAVTFMNWIHRVLSWDSEWIQENVHLEGEHGSEFEHWTLTLRPKMKGATSIDEIQIYGEFKQLRKIIVQTGPQKSVEISLIESHLNPRFQKETLDRYFPAYK